MNPRDREALNGQTTHAETLQGSACQGNAPQASVPHSPDLAGPAATTFGLPSRTVVYGAAAVTIALLAGTAIWTTRPVTIQPASGFGLASVKSGETALLLIRFSPQATEPQINKFLGTYQAVVVSGPRRGNFYDIRLTGEPSEADINEILHRMQNETDIVDLVAEKE